jgi:hypothetical protein
MASKMFYTLDETKAALGQSEDQIKTLTRDGRLREFRDGPRLMFKADQVDALKSQIGGGGYDIADSGAPIGLADTGGGSSIGLNLADSVSSGLAGIAGSGLGSGVGSGGAGSGMMNLKEDTALAADLGMSGTIGGIPSPGRTSGGSLGGSVGGGSLGGSMSGSLSGTAGSRQGINVFGDDTHLPADPMAQTAMPGLGSGADLNLEGVGSGSGLLDLTRESDETSLGAELIDEISTGKSRPMGPPDTGSMAGVVLEAPRGGIVRGTMGPVVVEKPDRWSTAFGAFALGASVVLMVTMFALATGVLGVHPAPDLIGYFADKSFVVITGIGLIVAVIFLAFGKLIDMSFGGR